MDLLVTRIMEEEESMVQAQAEGDIEIEEKSDADEVNEEEDDERVNVEIVEKEKNLIEAVKTIPIPLLRTEKTVNCLFCYEPVQKYDEKISRVERRLIIRTTERLFRYILKHLELDTAVDEFHTTISTSKKDVYRFRPGNLPLCLNCRMLYYRKVYDGFVAYELAMDELNEKIAAVVIQRIGESAKKNKDSVEDDEEEGGVLGRGLPLGCMGNLDAMISTQAKASYSNEHEIMGMVKRFRKKVAEKKPIGYLDEDIKPTASISLTNSPDDLQFKNVINVVRNKRNKVDPTAISNKQIATCKRIERLRKDMEKDINSDKTGPVPPPPPPSLECYAITNPCPGVIKIIPMITEQPRKKKQKRNERDYADRRLHLLTCKFCNKLMPDELSFKRHMVKEHGMEKPIKCPKCDYRTVDKNYLTRHMEIHLDEKQRQKFQCDICGQKFTVKATLKAHMDHKHAGKDRRKYICEICGKQFFNNSGRQKCLDRHKDIKKFVCPFPNCGKSFQEKNVLKIHERTHTGEKPFKCHICEKCFSQRSPLRIHLKKIHQLEK